MSTLVINLNTYPVYETLTLLLKDRSTGNNILFATDDYTTLGPFWNARQHIVPNNLIENGACIIQPRVLKSQEEQTQRTRQKAEVFTPAWVCCLMNNFCDEEWFGRKDVFNHLEGKKWTPTEDPIPFRTKKEWQAYVDSRRLEIGGGD
jgi:hypothetical protein